MWLYLLVKVVELQKGLLADCITDVHIELSFLHYQNETQSNKKYRYHRMLEKEYLQ